MAAPTTSTLRGVAKKRLRVAHALAQMVAQPANTIPDSVPKLRSVGPKETPEQQAKREQDQANAQRQTGQDDAIRRARYAGYNPGEPLADKERKLHDKYEGDALGRRLAREEFFKEHPNFGGGSLSGVNDKQAKILRRKGLLGNSPKVGPMERLLGARLKRLQGGPESAGPSSYGGGPRKEPTARSQVDAVTRHLPSRHEAMSEAIGRRAGRKRKNRAYGA
jgi:hypothetical protein